MDDLPEYMLSSKVNRHSHMKLWETGNRGILRIIKEKYATKMNVYGLWMKHQDCK